MCLEFMRGPDQSTQHIGGDGLLKRLYRRYYKNRKQPKDQLQQQQQGSSTSGTRGRDGARSGGRHARLPQEGEIEDEDFEEIDVGGLQQKLYRRMDPYDERLAGGGGGGGGYMDDHYGGGGGGGRGQQSTSPLLAAAGDNGSRSSLAMAQNEGVITWTAVHADKRTLTLEALLNMSPVVNGVDLVSRASRQLFLSHVKTQTNVRDTFFPNHEPDRYETQIDPEWFEFEEFANAYVCHALYQYRDEYNIHKMIAGDKVDELLTDFYLSPDWKKVGFALYTMLFKDLVVHRDDMIPFRAYLESDRRYWASALADKLRDSQWLHKFLHPGGQGRNNERITKRDINILFVKLHLLDPTTVFPAFTTIQKAVPDLNLELVTTNYLGEPFDRRDIKSDIQAAVNKPTLPKNASKVSMEPVDVYYGIPVIEFIMLEPKQMGLWSGRYADNKRTTGMKDRCSIM